MKKLRLNKIFHWLYAFLMFMPIISYLGQFLLCFGLGNYPEYINIGFENFVINSIGITFVSGIGLDIWNVFDYLFTNVLGISQFSDGYNSLFAYWLVISIVYLVFDVLIFIVNVAHSWLDKGADKLC